MNLVYFSTFAMLTFPCSILATLSKSDKKSSQNNKRKLIKTNPLNLESASYGYSQNVSINFQDILSEHNSFSIVQSVSHNFPNQVLGYVTPWNNHGYEIAKLFTAKFTIISPVWLQLKPKSTKETVMIDGLHDIDESWILSLQESNHKIKIVPRLIFEQWDYENILNLFQRKEAIADLCSKLIDLAKDKDFSGYVIEIWNMLGGQLRKEVTKFLIDVSKALRNQNLETILVIPPPLYFNGQKGTFSREDFLNLAGHISAFSLMSYDYSNFYRPGPNSPLPWLIGCVNSLEPDASSENRKKILLGLNFYGYDYSKSASKAVVGND